MEEILIKKSESKAIKVAMGEFKNTKFLQIMEMWKSDSENEWKFSKKNITIGKTNIKEFIEFIVNNKDEILEGVSKWLHHL